MKCSFCGAPATTRSLGYPACEYCADLPFAGEEQAVDALIESVPWMSEAVQ